MDEQVKKMMKSLGCTEEEARQLIADDDEIDHMTIKETESDLSAEQKKTVKKARQADRTTAYKFTKRERKPNEDKRHLIGMIKVLLEGLHCPVDVTNIEREIVFTYHDVKYKIVLSAPRT